MEINEAILEVIALTRGEMVKNNVSVQTQLAEGLPHIPGDRVQLQQVVLNLTINAVEAMSGVSEGSRELLIGTGKDASGGVLVELPGPESSEAQPVPANHGLGANEVECFSPRGPMGGEPHPEESIEAPELRPFRSSSSLGTEFWQTTGCASRCNESQLAGI